MDFYQEIKLGKVFRVFIIIFLFLFQNIGFAEEKFEPAYIYRTKEELEEIKMNNMLLMRAPAPLKAQPRGQKSLLEFVPYIGADRDQGACGNCWVWSSTASIEIQNAAFRNIKDRLSIQYFDSNYGYPDYKDFVCMGGYPFKFVSFYSRENKLIPWSNENADYKDKDGGKICNREDGTSYECPNVDPNKIVETPNYHMESLGLYNIVQPSDNDEEISEKIKYYINNNIPLTLDFCFGDLNDFSDFWCNSDEETIFDLTNIPDNKNSDYFIGCHSTTIIGYNDKSNNKDEHYYEVLNSWGTPQNRPHGTFRIKMNGNYHKNFCISDEGCHNVIQGIYVMNPHFQNADENVGNVIIKAIDNNENYISNERIIFNNQEYFTDKNGVIIIPNIKNGTQYNISLYMNNGYEYNEELDDLKCYEYEKKEFQGILDFSDNNEVIFTFKKNYIDNQNENAKFPMLLFFIDEDGNEIDNVTINFNGQIFHSGRGKGELEIQNVPNHFDYEISVYKDNYIFDNMSIKGKTNYHCELDNNYNDLYNNYKTFTFTGHEVTGNNVTVKVVDVNNNVIPDEVVIFNGERYLTDSNGEINFENFKSGKDYDVEISPYYYERSVLIDGKSVCYNYDNENRKQGTFDFTENKHQILTFVRHYNDYSHSSDLSISFDDGRRGISDVIVDFNGKIFFSNMYGSVCIDNLPYGTTYKIKYSKGGYLSGEYEGKFIDNLSEYDKVNCFHPGIGFTLKKDENYIPPTNTQTNNLTSTPTKVNFTKTFTPTRTKKPSSTATKTKTFTKTFTVTNTITNTSTNPNTNTYTSTNTDTFTFTNTYTLVPTDTSTFTYTPTKLIVIPTSTFTPIVVNTPIIETPIVNTPISTPIETKIVEPMGKIAVKIVDILGSGVSDVNVIFNKEKTYITDVHGYVYIDNVKLDEKFSLVWYRDGYLFDPNFYDGILTSSNNELNLKVTIYADNAYTNCKEVKIDLKKLRKNVSKIYKFSQILSNEDTEIINKKFLKIRKIINKIPLNVMICKDNKKFNTVSFKRQKAQLQKSIKILYKEMVLSNRSYARENDKNKRWIKKRLLKMKRYFNIARSEASFIPGKIYYVKE